MVDPGQLTYDLAATVTSLALAPALWLFLALFAWRRRAVAESVGLGPRTFWLLVPGSLFAYYAILTFAPVGPDLVAIDLGGALFPLVVSLALLRPAVGPRLGGLLLFVGWFAAEAGAALAVVLFVPSATLEDALVGVVAVGFSAGAFALPRLLPSVQDPGAPTRFGAFVALASGVLVASFLASFTVAGQGIEEIFPVFLAPPIAAGVVAATLGPWLYGERPERCLPLAFAATTFGILVGSDLLRQPPLYVGGPGALYVIGGANVFDLVYLSGLLALVSAYAASGPFHVEPGAAGPPRPLDRLRWAAVSDRSGDHATAIREAAAAARESAEQARRLLGAPPAPTDRPWEGLPAPAWVAADQANLEALARRPPDSAPAAEKARTAARALCGVGLDLSRRRFASLVARAGAMAIDLAVVTAPAVGLLVLLAERTGGGSTGILNGLGFSAATFGYIAVAYLYFVLAERVAGRTLGKWIVGLEVSDRSLRRIDLSSAFVRNVPRLPTLTVIAIAGSASVALAVAPAGPSPLAGFTSEFALVAYSAIAVAAVLLFGLIGGLAILLSDERQRVGDRWASTWVVRRRAGDPRAAAAGAAPPSSRP